MRDLSAAGGTDGRSAGDGASPGSGDLGGQGRDLAGGHGPDADPGGPDRLFDGPPASARVPGWDPAAPRPLIVLARYTGTMRWVLAGAAVEPDGTVDGLVNVDRIAVFGPSAMAPVGDGVPGAVLVAGWDPSTPAPLVVLARYSGTLRWAVASLASVEPTGAIDGLVNVDRIVVWRIPSPPQPAYDGPYSGARLAGWNAAAPPALVVAARYGGTTRWVVSATEIETDGTLDGLVNVDHMKAWQL